MKKGKEVALSLVMTSLPNKEIARVLSERMLKERLAACVSAAEPALSRYWWKEKICVEREVVLFIKTAANRVKALREWLVAQHPYEMPEFLVLSVADAYEPYARWVVAETRGAAPAAIKQRRANKGARKPRRSRKG